MERPDKVWLDVPVTIDGIEIKCTEEGCRYYAHHNQQVLEASIRLNRIDAKDIPHAQEVVEKYKLWITLYERAASRAVAAAGPEQGAQHPG